MEMLLRRFALAFGLVCGVIGAQAPEFAQQYRQRLAGAADELSREVATFDAEARGQNVTPEAAIGRLESDPDPLAEARGRDMADDKARLARLDAALAAYTESGPVRRLAATLENFDSTVARRAWGDFQPAVPTTTEGFTVGAAGLCAGWLVAHLALWPIRRRAAARRRGLASA